MTSATPARCLACVAVLMLAACMPSVRITPLASAARSGDLDSIDRLLAAGADVNEPTGVNGWPPVVHAIHTRQRQAVVRLLERGASLEGTAGRDALFMASGYGDAETVAILLSRGVPLPQDAPSLASLVAVTIGGAWDIDYQWSGCERHTAVAKLLVAKDPDVRVVGILSPTSVARARSTFEYRVARWYAQHKGCDELLRIVGRGEG
jgi:ankyrin repeat protein